MKIRIADVVEIDDSPLSPAECKYALMAHFDFVIAQSEYAVLAIEYDGPTHANNQKCIARDEKKQRICDLFCIPLIRVSGYFLRPIEDSTLLEWLLARWFERRHYLPHIIDDNNYCARGYIGFIETDLELTDSADEDDGAEPMSIPETMEKILSRMTYRYDLDPFCNQRYFVIAKLMGEYDVETYLAKDELGFLVAVKILWLDAKRAIIGFGRCQVNRHFPVDEQAIVQDLAVIDLYDKYLLFSEKGDQRVVDSASAHSWKEAFQQSASSGAPMKASDFKGIEDCIFEQWRAIS